MRTLGSSARPQRRSLWHLIEDSIGIFQQDASEYAFIGLIGAFAACVSTLILLLVGGAAGAVLTPLLFVVVAVVTLATITEALRRVTDNLEPAAAESFTLVLRGLPAILLPWAPLAIGLSVAALLDEELGHLVPSPARGGIELGVIVVALYVALGRVLAVPSLVVRRCQPAAAVRESHQLFGRTTARTAGAWGVCLLPSLLLFLVPAFGGFGAVSTAIAALVFTGSLAFTGVVNTLLFFDAASEQEVPVAVAARAASASRTARPIR
jgi:hypothetical protein